MKKDVEQFLWDRIGYAGISGGNYPRDIINGMVNIGLIQSHKQAWATLRKWCRKGIYNYGVSLDLGWKQ